MPKAEDTTNEQIREDPLDLMDEIDRLKKEKRATILAHYYVDGDLQDIADFTGDSLKLARQTTQVDSTTIVFCGVHFMAETAKILNPGRRSFCRICWPIVVRPKNCLRFSSR